MLATGVTNAMVDITTGETAAMSIPTGRDLIFRNRETSGTDLVQSLSPGLASAYTANHPHIREYRQRGMRKFPLYASCGFVLGAPRCDGVVA